MGLNYERQEVRDYFYAMIRELVMDYDAKGLELDFLRTPAICEPGATQEMIDTVTGWMAEIRALTSEKANDTGKPYSFGLRIPAALGALESIGLDVRGIVDAGLGRLPQLQQLHADGVGLASRSPTSRVRRRHRDLR